MSLGALNGTAVANGRVQVGAWGAWYADLDLADPTAFAKGSPGVLTLADQTLAGTVIAGGVANGAAAYRIVGGKGGLGKSLPAKPYASDLGVKAATVIGDALREAGEIPSPLGLPTTRLGPHFTRASGGAWRVLQDITPAGWYVDFAGFINFGSRISLPYTGSAARTHVDPQGAIIELATETLAGLVPGVIVDGSAPASDVEYLLTAKRLTVRVWAGAARNRRVDALARTVAALFPEIKWSGAYEFRVVEQTGERFDLQPVRTNTGMPSLGNVPVRGPAGVRATVTPGELVAVAFMDRDPSRPFIFAHDAPDAPGWMPIELDLGQTPQLGVARLTDAVIAGGFGGVITHASVRVKAGL